MLGKLLKYDIRSFYKLWIITAITSLFFSVVGGLCSPYALDYSSSVDQTIHTVTLIGYIISTLCIAGFFALGFIVPYYRFYYNYYTDEGYLTFTLPATKHQHLLSKLIFALIFNLSTALVLALDIIVINLLSHGFDGFGGDVAEFNPWSIVYGAQVLIIVASVIVSGVLLSFFLISFCSKFSKKIQTLIGFFLIYGLFMIFIILVFFIIGIGAMDGISWSDLIPDGAMNLVTALLLLSVDGACVTVTALLYLAEYRMLDKGLNLA
ncbi:MAG: hypothetical protein E7676_02435 [Ruminococcaceae bacterium]|nr:hypothetical protein [Oscillospiraceae bacterium]